MSILSALSENRHEKKNLADLAKLPQALIMQMGQRKELTQEEVAMVISKKAEAIESAARQKALEQGGGQMPSVIEQDMMKIAQSENPAPPMPQQQMQQQMMPQQMAQAQQLPEDVGIAQNPVPPMQMAGGGIIAFDEGGDVDVDPEDDYQELIDQANQDATNDEIFGIIAAMEGSGGRSRSADVGIRAGENKNITQDTRERSGDMIDRLRAQILQKESGGKRYDKNGNLLTSSKGALGEMQVMPATARDPGFGIKPAQNNDPNELRRVGDEYANVLLNRYRDPKLAMIAYNMGPGATDKWLAAGADISKLPKETQGYIRGVNLAKGGEVKHFVLGDLVMDDFGNPRGPDPRSAATYDDFNRTAAELEDEIRRSKKAGVPKDRASKAAEKALEDQKLRRAAMTQPKVPPAATTPYERYIKPALGKPSVAGVAVPAGIVAGGGYLSNAAANTLAGNKEMANAYFGDEYSDPGSDNAIAYHILQNAKPPKQKDEVIDPNIERLKKMVTYGNAPPVRAPEQKAPTEATTPKEKAEDDVFNFMQYIRDRQARADKSAESDKWQAGLAAGLGMLGGTSQYWQENIGKGGQMGVQQLAQLQKLRASQDIAGDKMLGTAYNAEMLNKLRKEQLAQGKESKSDKLAQDLIIARQAHVDRAIKERGMDMTMMHNLEREKAVAAAEGKTFDTKKQATLDYYRNMNKRIQDEAMKMYPSQLSGSGYSARRIGQ
jgi:hypothetical protein